MFVDTTQLVSDPVGGTDWMQDAYDAAKGGSAGIRDYDPIFNVPEDQEFMRLLEAGNRAYWLQAVAGNDKFQSTGSLGDLERFFVESAYSATNAEETLATLHAVLTSEYTSYEDLEQLLKNLDELYPWLVEAWLKFFNPGSDQSDILDDLGYSL
jgi:hypothetical protein